MTAGSIHREGDHVVIRIPASEVQSLCVALAECPCKGAKSNGTTNIRTRLRKGLKSAITGKAKA